MKISKSAIAPNCPLQSLYYFYIHTCNIWGCPPIPLSILGMIQKLSLLNIFFSSWCSNLCPYFKHQYLRIKQTLFHHFSFPPFIAALQHHFYSFQGKCMEKKVEMFQELRPDISSLINYFLFHLRASKHADIVYGNILSGVKMCLNSVINA